MNSTLLQVPVGLATAWVIKFLLQKYLAIQSVAKACPGGSVLWLHPFRPMSLLAASVFPFEGRMGYYFAKFSIFAKHGSTCLSSVTFWDGVPVFWLSDADAIKTVQTSRSIFPKDMEAYKSINIYGPSMIGVEGSDWKRHRSVANSAFNETNNSLVWRETSRIVDEWFSQIDNTPASQDGVIVNLLNDLTQITLAIISSAGFGRYASLKDASKTDPPPGHTRTFRDAISSTLAYLLPKVALPSWLFNLSSHIYIPLVTPFLKETQDSFDALRLHMLDIISLARDWVAGGKTTSMEAALLRNLVEANMIHGGDSRYLTDEELLSNTFTFLLAGHETSAHTLCFAIALLALHPEVQKRVYEEACLLWPRDLPTSDSLTPDSLKESMAMLEYTSAAIHETLRLFPPVARLGKTVVADTTLKARRFSTKPDGQIHNVEEYNVPIKAGSLVLIDVFGLHMNPIHWGDDVAEFIPERFIDTDTYRWPRDAFGAFSTGPRSCIGQRFALTESVCILARLTRMYEICVPEEFSKNKSLQEQTESLLQWSPGITITPNNARVTLRRRL